MNNAQRTRREFLWDASIVLASAMTAPFFVGCSHVTATEELNEGAHTQLGESRSRTPRTRQAPDVTLTTDMEELAQTIKSQYTKLQALAENAGRQLRIAFPFDGGQEVLRLTIVAGGAARYRHVRVERETTGEAANLLWGREGLYPSIKLTDDNGRTIVKDGKDLEFSFQLAQRKGRDPRSWLELGIKIAAIALLVWLGASILKPIVAAIAFIAFNAMVIGIAIAGVALLVVVVRWILDVTGWTLEDVRAMFERSMAEILQVLTNVVQNLG